MNIIGINAYHGDSSACIMLDGELRAAVEEERFRRIKHWAGFPSMAIQYCLEETGLSLTDIDVIAVNSDPKANVFKKLEYAIKKRPSLSVILEKAKMAKKRQSISDELETNFPGVQFNGKVEHVEHHLSHLASSYYASPYDHALTVSVDGFGDFSSSAWGIGENQTIDVKQHVHFPHSLGIFYQALTQYLGFPNYGDEYKVMGLAPYGKPRFLDKMKEIVILESDGSFSLNLDYFRHHNENISYQWENHIPEVGTLFSTKLESLLGPVREEKSTLTQEHYDIANSIQAMYEDAFFHLVNTIHGTYNIDSLTLAGGCAMNSVANGKVYRKTNIKQVYIQSAAGDAGGAIGAAYVVSANAEEICDKSRMQHAYWGPSFSDQNIKSLLDEHKEKIENAGCEIKYFDDEYVLYEETAKAIDNAGVIGWFQGRMEWGPRALGNRSILADPRRGDMKDILNLKIKRRESFRPFAPSILREEVNNWFEEDDEVPFMMKVFQIQEAKRKEIPAVTHVDGSGRLQTVFKETNPRYHGLISAFKKLSGVPILLNTSFNENEPVVCHPKEALDCFLRTKMDVLVCGNYFIRRINV